LAVVLVVRFAVVTLVVRLLLVVRPPLLLTLWSLRRLRVLQER
jgi:hypothetical protein